MKLKKLMMLSMLLGTHTSAAETSSYTVTSGICLSDEYLCRAVPPYPLEDVLRKYDEKIKSWGAAIDQLERFFAPMTRGDSQEIRDLANIIINYTTLKYNKLCQMKIYYESHQGKQEDTFSSNVGAMLDAPSKDVGRHSALRHQRDQVKAELDKDKHDLTVLNNVVKEIQTDIQRISDADKEFKEKIECTWIQIKGLEEKIQQKSCVPIFPSEAQQLDAENIAAKEVEDIQVRLKNLRAELDDTSTQEKQGREKLQEKQKCLVALQEEVHKRREALPAKEAAYKKYQEEADLYALIKYISVLNLYAVLPNDDFNLKGYDKDAQLEIIPMLSLPLLQDVITNATMLISEQIFHLVSPQIMEQTIAIIKEKVNILAENKPYLSSTFSTNNRDSRHALLAERLKKHLQNSHFKSYSEPSYTHLLNDIFIDIRDGTREPDYAAMMEKCKPSVEEVNITFPQKISPPSGEEILEAAPNQLRVDRLLKESLEKWRRKISKGENSLIPRNGLDSYLFNFRVPLNVLPFVMLPPPQVDDPFLQGELPENVWRLGVNQLNQNWCDLLMEIGDVSILRSRIKPIYQFVTQKAERAEQANIEQAKKEKVSKNHTAEHIFLKYLSYANFKYAVEHDILGKEIQLAPLPVYSSPDRPQVETFSIEKVLAHKAHKWLNRLMLHEDFIEKHALKAWMLSK